MAKEPSPADPRTDVLDTATGHPVPASPPIDPLTGKPAEIDAATGRPFATAPHPALPVNTAPVTNLGAVRDDIKAIRGMVNDVNDRMATLAGRLGI